MSARGAGPCARTGREGATVAEPDNLDGTRRSGARPDAPRRAARGTDGSNLLGTSTGAGPGGQEYQSNNFNNAYLDAAAALAAAHEHKKRVAVGASDLFGTRPAQLDPPSTCGQPTTAPVGVIEAAVGSARRAATAPSTPQPAASVSPPCRRIDAAMQLWLPIVRQLCSARCSESARRLARTNGWCSAAPAPPPPHSAACKECPT